jgi:hypothetical protein
MQVFRENPQNDITPYLRRAWICTRNVHISWPIWVKFGTDNLHVMQFNSYGFRENRWNTRGAVSTNSGQSCEHTVECLVYSYVLLLVIL